MSEHYCMYKDGMCELDIDEAYELGRADQKKEDNAFFNFESVWELEKQKIREDAYKEFAEVIAMDIADCKTCPIDCKDNSYGECEKRLVQYVKAMRGEDKS